MGWMAGIDSSRENRNQGVDIKKTPWNEQINTCQDLKKKQKGSRQKSS